MPLLPAPPHTALRQTAKIGSLVDISDSEDPEGLRVFYYLIQDLRVCLLTITAFHITHASRSVSYSPSSRCTSRSSPSERWPALPFRSRLSVFPACV
jgi:hypothetical protein